VNSEAARVEDLPEYQRCTVDVEEGPPVSVRWFDAESTGRTSQQHGIAFWVSKRLVGHPSWNVADRQVLDGRTREAKRLTAIVEADDYKDQVLPDWSWFKSSQRAAALLEAVADHATTFVRDYMAARIEETKTAVLDENRDRLSTLGRVAQKDAEDFVDMIARQDPLLPRQSLSIATQALIKLEQTRSGRELLERLAAMEPEDIEGLNKLLEDWSVRDALAVLDEIDRRMRVIEAIEKLSGDPAVHETRTLHPLVTQARWLFGPEYESPHFASNATIRKALEAIFENSLLPASDFVNPKKRPDLLFLEDATISAVAEEEWVDAKIVRTKKILLIELKRGGAAVGRKARDQAVGYIEDILHLKHLEATPVVVAFVVGDTIEPKTSLSHKVDEGGHVHLAHYDQLVRTANARLFRLRTLVSERYDVADAPSLQRYLHANERTLFEG
jgi:hypothetical protein